MQTSCKNNIFTNKQNNSSKPQSWWNKPINSNYHYFGSHFIGSPKVNSTVKTPPPSSWKKPKTTYINTSNYNFFGTKFIGKSINHIKTNAV